MTTPSRYYVVPTYPTEPAALLHALLEREIGRVNNNFGLKLAITDDAQKAALTEANDRALAQLRAAAEWVNRAEGDSDYFRNAE